MPTHTVKLLLVQTVHQTYTEEFDPFDDNKWRSLIERIDPEILEDGFPQYPEKTTGNLADWLKLYQLLRNVEYENQEEDYWISDIKGFTEYSWEIKDQNGNIVAETS